MRTESIRLERLRADEQKSHERLNRDDTEKVDITRLRKEKANIPNTNYSLL